MWVVRSKDDGATFSAEEPALERETGACGCCGTRALADRRGTLYLLYRAATGGVERDMYLLSSDDHAGHFRGASIHPWRAETCPMSSATMAEAGPGVLAAWETKGQVYFSRVDPQTHEASPPIAPPGGRGDRKHPAVAGNARGETILVWTEGTGWQKGGALAWQVFDRSGRPSGPSGRIKDGVPVWGLATVVAGPDGGFTIITSAVHPGSRPSANHDAAQVSDWWMPIRRWQAALVAEGVACDCASASIRSGPAIMDIQQRLRFQRDRDREVGDVKGILRGDRLDGRGTGPDARPLPAGRPGATDGTAYRLSRGLMPARRLRSADAGDRLPPGGPRAGRP